jgi:lysophospholipase L1-like esterase
MIGRVAIIWVVFFFFLEGTAQQFPSYNKELTAFMQQDSIAFPTPGQVLFIGSSSFTNWKDVQDYFPGVSILNRAFGGSSLIHLIQYQHVIIYPYKPGKIVIYCGENDFAENKTLSVDIVVGRFRQLFSDIRSRMPGVPIVYVSMKPSPGRRDLMPKYLQANIAIRKFLRQQKNTQFVDVYQPMLLASGNPNPFIFLNDSVHMNAAGYRIWQRQIGPALEGK